MFEMIITLFLIDNKDEKSCFSKKMFLLTNISMDIAFEIVFFIISNNRINYNNKDFRWWSYTITKAFFTIKEVPLIGKKEFAVVIIVSNDKIFVVYIISLISLYLDIYSSYRVKIVYLKADKISIIVVFEYIDFVDVFSLDLVVELLEHIKINNDAIELINDKQYIHMPIYNLKLIKLKTLKIYIKFKLENNFIKLSKSLINVPILII